jgi:hypothetical protein
VGKSQFIWLVSLAGLVAVLAVVIVMVSVVNERTQRELQARQVALNSGVLGPQGQQIGNAILQEMAAAAVTNRSMRALLKKHGYTIQPTAVDRSQESGDRRQNNE